MTKILAFSGSIRKGSYNQQLIRFAANKAQELGAEVTLIDLADYPMPLYCGDIESEQGIPETAKRLFDLMYQHNGLLLACPEYNGSFTPLLKNSIDWVSRVRVGSTALAAYSGKVAGLLSASPGQLGGLRGLGHVRDLLGNLGMLVIPNQASISGASEAFDDRGQLKDPKVSARVEGVLLQLMNTTKQLSAASHQT